jgi:hypothetical protein
MGVLVTGCATFQPDGLDAFLSSQRPAYELAPSALHHPPPSAHATRLSQFVNVWRGHYCTFSDANSGALSL